MQLVVHRGRNEKCPENSICGIQEIIDICDDAIIEIDIVPTKDGKLVLFHDLSLMRLCKIDELVFNFTFKELNEIQNICRFASLDEVLHKFPNQKFLLDIRCSYHPDFFLESKIDIHKLKENLYEKYFNMLQKIDKKNLIITCSDLNMAKKFQRELGLSVELSENYTRKFLYKIEKTSDLSFIEFELKKINIQNRFLTYKLVEIFHKNNVEVYSTPSMKRSIENSKIMLQRAKKYNCDGIWLSPINSDIIKQLRHDGE